jgi:SSS family solute:Na+ symporter
MVSGLFIPVLGALFWKKSHPIAAFLGMLLGGNHNIITENKLPLGKYRTFRRKYLWNKCFIITISIYHNNKRKNKMEFKIINNFWTRKIYTNQIVAQFLHSLRRIW